MIEEPPLLTIAGRASRNRPSAAQIAAFRDMRTGVVCDAMDGTGALDPAIKPLLGLPQRLVGPALTCDSGPADILALLASLSEVEPGDVLVNATGGWRGCAAQGDQVMGMARNAGAAGAVTDGMARDIDGLRQVGLPLFCIGLNPNSPHGKGPGTVGLPVQIGGRTVASGDMIVADEDGVVVVPFARIDAVVARAAEVMRLEEDLGAEVAAGLTVPENIKDLLESEAVARV